MELGRKARSYNADQVRILATLSFMMILSTTIFLLRLLARRISVARYWYDDYLVLVALVLSFGPNIFVLVAVHFGLGQHAAIAVRDGVGGKGVSHVLQMAYLTGIFWQLTMPTAKTSLLLFYIRIFPERHMRIVAYITGTIMWSFCIASTIVDINMCKPISHFWNIMAHDHCVNAYTFYMFGAIMQFLTDVAVLIIPLPFVWSLKVCKAKKTALSIIFLLGSFVCVASIMRIVLNHHFIPSDITGLAVDLAIWTCVEGSLAVICACIPCMTPLLVRIARIRKPPSEAESTTLKPCQPRRQSGFYRMNELPELEATFEMTLYGNDAECRALNSVPDCSLPSHGISVTREVNVKQSVVRRPS